MNEGEEGCLATASCAGLLFAGQESLTMDASLFAIPFEEEEAMVSSTANSITYSMYKWAHKNAVVMR